ncbi:MAG: alanine--tRNA ligase [Bacteroidetes bacterium]|nr:MAG: alanine--tRNA ligase [Bacteroidota bacterium]
MNSSQVRKVFLDFFKNKQHQIVPSAPMVIKDDPTLMFTNAGMNQFKDIFLGNTKPKFLRAADTQKCLRVSGKHNDLEEVGRDTYHHTMFEMLGNWSFGDYFKKEAIAWAWELLTDVYGINKDNLYVTVFGGDEADGMEADMEAYNFWKAMLPEEKIIYGSKKDNFWEMGEVGPCGSCSEIHIDLRSEEEKKVVPGKALVNMDHPEVIEIWNLVFIEFNRLADGSLEALSAKHIDTGMGFERLSMVMQGVKSNYDTDIFAPIIKKVAEMAGVTYGKNESRDIALRVIADHLRAITFAIADGQLPSNTGAGYVIRRILRRAVRYGYTFLSFDAPFMYKLVALLSEQMGEVFTELVSQQTLIEQVIKEEEAAFLRTLAQGIRKFETYFNDHPNTKEIDGDFAFELFDTFGFPIDLTNLMASEKGVSVDMDGFEKGLQQQKERSRKAAVKNADDWIELLTDVETAFVGYDTLEAQARVVKYRKVVTKKKTIFEIVLDTTPFYAESGGQVGDTGELISESETLHVVDTKKENNLIVHLVTEEPKAVHSIYKAIVNTEKRILTANNHSTTHLMHAALRKVLGTHVEQKGSLVSPDRLRFDFSHFSKMSDEEIRQVEAIVNSKIRENLPGEIKQDVAIEEAKAMGAMALFGEKYGDKVRVVTFGSDYSVELCGGTHVKATGQIGLFKIISESGIAAGVRRIEAVTGKNAEKFVNNQIDLLKAIKGQFKNANNVLNAVTNLIEENAKLHKEIGKLLAEKSAGLADSLVDKAEKIGDVLFVGVKVDLDVNSAKKLANQLRGKADKIMIVFALVEKDKVNLVISLSDELVKNGYHAGNIIREAAKAIRGGGGGQPHLATAGGKEANGIDDAIAAAKLVLKS